MASISTEHLDIDPNGTARIAGKRTKVIDIVMDRMFQGWQAEEIHENYPDLTLAEIHAAFAYYYDHQAQLDEQIAEYIKISEEQRAASGDSEFVRRMKAAGRL